MGFDDDDVVGKNGIRLPRYDNDMIEVDFLFLGLRAMDFHLFH